MSQASLISAIHNSSPKRNAFPRREFNTFLPIVFESREQESCWFHMFKSMDFMKPMVTSIAPHGETLNSMGIRPQLYTLFERAYIDIDQVMGLPTHEGLVYEFLSSFSVIHGNSAYDEDTLWKFRIQNTTFQLSRRQAVFLLNFPEFGVYPRPTNDKLMAFWEKLTKFKELKHDSSPYSIDTSLWQMVHRLIATNINCQPETVDYVTMQDLEIMWALDGGEPIDWFKIFSIRFLSMQHQYGPQHFVGCTSLITLIAKTCGFRFMCPPKEHRFLDGALWRKLCIIARPFEFGPELTDVTEPNSWEEQAYFMEQEFAEEPADMQENAQSRESEEKKRRIELENGQELNDKIEWDKVRRVVVYQF